MAFKKEFKKQVLEATHRWIEQIIIGLNLCPFAKAPYLDQRVRIVLTDASNSKSFIKSLREEIRYLQTHPHKETTLLIAPAFHDAADFYRIYLDSEIFLETSNLKNEFQLVSFHPMARIRSLSPWDAQNLVMIAPYPTLHILRVASVNQAGAKMRRDVQETNSARLSAMSQEEFKQIWYKVLTGQ